VDRKHLVHDTGQWWALVKMVIRTFMSIKDESFLDWLNEY